MKRDPELTRFLRSVGPAWAQDIRAAGDRTKQQYQPRIAAAPRAGVTVEAGIAYGPHPRQQLDLYRPAGARAAPVLAFVHGGAFVRGARDLGNGMYGNVLTWFARQGWLGVNIGYRLADEAPYPGGAMDVARACQWIARHIGTRGGDPARLCLVGHSAGGTHAASYACDPALDGMERVVRGLVLLSGRLRADVLPANPNAAGVRSYFGADADLAQRSPVTHAARCQLPVLVVNAQYDNPLLDVYALEFALALAQARGQAPLHLALADHNHVSMVAHFNTGEQWLGEQTLAFCEAACA